MSGNDVPQLDAVPLLSGWKEIARHMGRGVRTVQRYERDLGLPVYRPGGRSHGSVLARIADIDAWLTSHPLEQSSAGASSTQNAPEPIVLSLRELLARAEQVCRAQNELRRALENSVQALRTTIRAVNIVAKEHARFRHVEIADLHVASIARIGRHRFPHPGQRNSTT